MFCLKSLKTHINRVIEQFFYFSCHKYIDFLKALDNSLIILYNYNVWGNCTVENFPITGLVEDFYIGDVNPFRYRGYYWCEALQMYHLQTRWYDPTIGRFISPDSYEYLDSETFGGLNLYAYCLNNPIMYTDPSGHSAILTGLIIGAISGGYSG